MQNQSTSPSPAPRPQSRRSSDGSTGRRQTTPAQTKKARGTCAADESIACPGGGGFEKSLEVGCRHTCGSAEGGRSRRGSFRLRRTVSCQLSQTLNTLPRAACAPLVRRAPRRFPADDRIRLQSAPRARPLERLISWVVFVEHHDGVDALDAARTSGALQCGLRGLAGPLGIARTDRSELMATTSTSPHPGHRANNARGLDAAESNTRFVNTTVLCACLSRPQSLRACRG